MENLLNAFKEGSKDSKDGPYSYYQNSLLLQQQINTVPMTIVPEDKKSSLEYGQYGYKHFHPWFLADLNPSSVDEYFILNKEEYWFFRGDINILMMWYRVSFIDFLFST